MSIPSISSSSVVPIQAAQPIKLSQVQLSNLAASTASPASSAAQEAKETPDVTRREAAAGDKQAAKLLVKAAAAQPQGSQSSLNIKA